jgi:hypothetical protein
MPQMVKTQFSDPQLPQKAVVAVRRIGPTVMPTESLNFWLDQLWVALEVVALDEVETQFGRMSAQEHKELPAKVTRVEMDQPPLG